MKKTSKKPLNKARKAPPKAATKKPRPVKENNTVYLSNLSYKRDKKGISNLASRYGTVKNINLIIDLDTKQSKGMAFVEMSSIEEAKRAIEGLNLQDIDGRLLKASFAIPQNPLTITYKSDKEEKPKKFDKSEKTEKAEKPLKKKPFIETRVENPKAKAKFKPKAKKK